MLVELNVPSDATRVTCRVITYTQAAETGASLRAVGWKVIASRPPRPGWSTQTRPRDDARYQPAQRLLWEAAPHDR